MWQSDGNKVRFSMCAYCMYVRTYQSVWPGPWIRTVCRPAVLDLFPAPWGHCCARAVTITGIQAASDYKTQWFPDYSLMIKECTMNVTRVLLVLNPVGGWVIIQRCYIYCIHHKSKLIHKITFEQVHLMQGTIVHVCLQHPKDMWGPLSWMSYWLCM